MTNQINNELPLISGACKQAFDAWYIENYIIDLGGLRNAEDLIRVFHLDRVEFKYGVYKHFFNSVNIVIEDKKVANGWMYEVFYQERCMKASKVYDVVGELEPMMKASIVAARKVFNDRIQKQNEKAKSLRNRENNIYPPKRKCK